MEIAANYLPSDNLRTDGAGSPRAGPAGPDRAPLLGLLRERLFPEPRPTRAEIWIQAVSVGEIEIAATLASALHDREPALSLLVSSSTPAGVALLSRRFSPDSGVAHRPFPLDLAFPVRRFFDAVSPRVFVLVETELWPRVLREARRRGVPVAVVNGRLSVRSLRRLRLFRPLFSPALEAVTRVSARTADDAARFVEAGLPPERVTVGGDLKLDRPAPPEPPFAGLLAKLADGRPVVVAGSIADGEIPVVLAARRALGAAGIDAFLLVAPRQPASFDDAFRRLSAAGLAVARRTAAPSGGERADVFLLDTIGELAPAYRSGGAALLGGTFVDKGGHNVLEPLRAGLPVVHGPSVWNIETTLDAVPGAVFAAKDGEDAGRLLASLLGDAEKRRRAAESAAAFFSGSAGATARAVEMILALRRGAS